MVLWHNALRLLSAWKWRTISEIGFPPESAKWSFVR
jgi:hypothetical protein